MWVPYTDTVVVVTNDPVPPELRLTPAQQAQRIDEAAKAAKAAAQAAAKAAARAAKEAAAATTKEMAAAKEMGGSSARPHAALKAETKAEAGSPSRPPPPPPPPPLGKGNLLELYDLARLPPPQFTPHEAVAPMRELLLGAIEQGKVGFDRWFGRTRQELESSRLRATCMRSRPVLPGMFSFRVPQVRLTAGEAEDLGMASLRDHLLAVAPLDVSWVRRVNAAEAKSWARCEAFRVGRNVDLLQFDCGGQQWVSEVRELLGARGRGRRG